MSERTQTEDIRPRAFIQAHERVNLIYNEIMGLGLERYIVELELYSHTVLADVKPIGFFGELRKTFLQRGAEDENWARNSP